MRFYFFFILFTVLFFPACRKGSGSEIGPQLPALPQTAFSGEVITSDGTPVVGAVVSLQVGGETRSFHTDTNGRFRFYDLPSGTYTLTIQGEGAAANGVGSQFPTWQIAAAVAGDTYLDIPLVFPELSDDPDRVACQTVNIGSPLTSAENITITNAGVTLDLNNTVVDWADPAAHAGETTVTLRVAILSGQQVPFSLQSSADGLLNSPLVFYIDPSDVIFTTAAGISFTSSYFADGSINVALYHYSLAAADWINQGVASVAGGVISASGLIDEAGFYALASPCNSSTTITGRILDAEGEPLAGIILTGGLGQRTLSTSNGSFQLADVCAVDGSDAALTSQTLQVAAAADKLPLLKTISVNYVPGGATDVGDQTFRTSGAGRFDFRIIERGKVAAYRRVSLGSEATQLGESSTSDAEGIVRFFDFPFVSSSTYRAFITSAESSTTGTVAKSAVIIFSPGNNLYGANIFIDSVNDLGFGTLDGTLTVSVVRDDSQLPIPNAFVILGTDPQTSLQGLTDSQGNIQFSTLGPVDVTAVVETQAAGGGGGFDFVRHTAAVTLAGVDTSSVIVRMPLSGRLAARSSYSSFSNVSGIISLATDPTQIAPSNISGTYIIDLQTTPSGDARELFSVMGETSDFAAVLPVGLDNSVGYTSGGTLDDEFVLAAPLNVAHLVAMERDSATPGTGPITRFGVSQAVNVSSSQETSADLALDFEVDSNTFSLLADNLDAALEPNLVATVGVEFANGRGALLGDFTDQLTFNLSTAQHSLQIPEQSGNLANAWYHLRLAAQTSSGGITQQQAVFLQQDPSLAIPFSGDFLALPTVNTPTPNGSDFAPDTGGIQWNAPSASSIQQIDLTRSATVMESGETIRHDFSWRVYLPSTQAAFIFPSLPTSSGEQTITPIFVTGNAYTLELRAMRAKFFSYARWHTNASRVRFSDFIPIAESIFSTTVTIP